jgi:RNA polymerase sigma factor (sigma-70 family)
MTSQRYGRKYAEGGYGATVNHLLGLGAKWDPAHEIAQAAWARGWERISQLRNEASLQWWVNAIARYLMISALRRDRRWVPLESEHELVSVSQIDNVGAKHLLQGCNSDERHLLEAYYLDGYTCPEIAVKLEKSVSAVQTALHRARRSVRIRTKLTAA